MSTNGRWRRLGDLPNDSTMKRRILAAGLWWYFAWYAVALIGHTIGAAALWEAAPFVGLLVGLAASLRANISPRATRHEPAT